MLRDSLYASEGKFVQRKKNHRRLLSDPLACGLYIFKEFNYYIVYRGIIPFLFASR